MIPKSGGEFPVLLEAFGPIPAYMFAWTSVVVLKPSALALLSLTFAKYALAPALSGMKIMLLAILIFNRCFLYLIALNGAPLGFKPQSALKVGQQLKLKYW